MSERIENLKSKVMIDHYPIGIEKFKIVLDTLRNTQGQPAMLKRAKIIENVLNRIPIFIEDGELLVGNAASKPCGLEIEADYGVWDEVEVAALKEDGFLISAEDEELLKQLNAENHPYTLMQAMKDVLGDDERLYPFLRSGMMLPPWRKTGAGGGGGYAMSGFGLGPGLHLLCVDYEIPLTRGLRSLINECQESLDKLRYFDGDCTERVMTYKSMIIAMEAMITFAKRFSKLALEMAEKEPDSNRKNELLKIAEICAKVPEFPAENFREAIQAFWFVFLMVTPSPTAAMGRFDQFMYPYYKKDTESGAITDEEVLEYLQCLRIKDMQIGRVSGKENRKKNSGMAKWHNMIIGGVKPDGTDASNELSYLIIEAAIRCKTPHHTITLRVADSTPKELIEKALSAVKQGLSMPAFISDKSYIKYFVDNGVPVEDARDYALTGCLDGNIPGRTRTISCGMFIVPMTLNVFFNDGIDLKSGLRLGHNTGDLDRFDTFDAFYDTYKQELRYFMELAAEKNNVEILLTREMFPDPVRSAFMHNGIKEGIDFHKGHFLLENSVLMNPIGMINLANSLYAIKTLVYEKKLLPLSKLKEALDANWEGYDDLLEQFRSVEKYGNNLNGPDAMAKDLYKYWADVTATLPCAYGGYHKPTGISVTSHQPGGELSLATPDGRRNGEILADGTVSPSQGDDINGPTSVLNSAMSIDQDCYQAMLLNMKFHPSAVSSKEDIAKLAVLIQTYFNNGGKHVQFNIVDAQTLHDAQKEPEKHRDLIVRVAGYSAYFVQLSKAMQDEIIHRTEFQSVAK